jgi:hypothetical protein
MVWTGNLRSEKDVGESTERVRFRSEDEDNRKWRQRDEQQRKGRRLQTEKNEICRHQLKRQ